MITVVVDTSRQPNPVHLGLAVLGELRRRGVPVVGVLWPVGVEWGVLTVVGPDLLSGEVEYTWTA